MAEEVEVVTLGPHGVAFVYDNKLYVAPLSGAERPVAHFEFPVGFSAGGVYTSGATGRRLLLRSDKGATLKVFGRGRLDYSYDRAAGSLYFVSGRTLMSARGARVREVTPVARLGFSAGPLPVLQVAGRLLELLGAHRLVMLRPDGSVFASTPLPRSNGHSENMSGLPAVDGRDSAVAFSTASGQTIGVETVYVLHAGAHAAIPVHREHFTLAPCLSPSATLEWHGRWLLYRGSGNTLAVIDTTGTQRATELSGVASSLRGMHQGYYAYWSGQQPAL